MSNLVVCFKQVPVEQYLLDRIKVAWSDVDIINIGQDRIGEALLEADFFCGHAKVPVDWGKIVKINRLKWIQSSAAGMDWCLVPEVIESKITITTCSGVLADQVAEHTTSLILSWMRSLPLFLKEQHDKSTADYHRFFRRPTCDLTDAVVGIIGFGGVGRRLAEVLSVFRTKILAVDLFPADKTEQVSELLPPDKLDEVLPQCDVVILCLPLNSQTRGMFNAAKFAKMRPEALFVNVARGALVNTDDLVSALQAKQIAGAVADVTSPEPLPPEHPLWDFPNVIITPHVAGQFHRRFDDVVDIFSANVKRYKSGEPLINYLTDEGKRLGFPIRQPAHPLWIDVKQEYTTAGCGNKQRHIE